MGKKRNLMISITAAALSALLVYGVYLLQVRQVRFEETVAVVVPNRFIGAGERLTAEMLTHKQIAKASFTPGMLEGLEEAVGKETIVPLGSGEPLLDWKVDQYRLLPDREQSTFQIPKPYILSISNGIRAGDRVILYVSGAETESGRLFQETVTVASVKTAANLEIDNINQPNLLSLANGDREKMYASRRDANGMIDFINLNLTEEQWLKLDRLCKEGANKVVIAYSPESLDIGHTAEKAGAVK